LTRLDSLDSTRLCSMNELLYFFTFYIDVLLTPFIVLSSTLLALELLEYEY
jgi:hypothetical protein